MKAIKCIFMGYGHDKKGYRCYDPLTGKVETVRDVQFLKGEVVVLDIHSDRRTVKEPNSTTPEVHSEHEEGVQPSPTSGG